MTARHLRLLLTAAADERVIYRGAGGGPVDATPQSGALDPAGVDAGQQFVVNSNSSDCLQDDLIDEVVTEVTNEDLALLGFALHLLSDIPGTIRQGFRQSRSDEHGVRERIHAHAAAEELTNDAAMQQLSLSVATRKAIANLPAFVSSNTLATPRNGFANLEDVTAAAAPTIVIASSDRLPLLSATPQPKKAKKRTGGSESVRSALTPEPKPAVLPPIKARCSSSKE
jgi:hypothetical protein